MNNIAAWFRSKNDLTHTIGTAIVGFAFAYNSSPDLRNHIASLMVGFPVVVTRLGVVTTDIVAAVTLWRNYAHSSSPAGTLATANFIRSDRNPDVAPTAAQVDAASVK